MSLRKLLNIIVIIIIICGGCERKIDFMTVPSSIDPRNADVLSRYIVLPDGSIRINGTPPAPNGGAQAPQVNSTSNGNVTASNGGTAALTFQIPAGTSGISGFFVQVAGAESYFNVPVTPGDNPNIASIPVQIPANVLEGTFCVNVWAYDQQGRVSGVTNQCVEVLHLGTGDLQINLTWDTDGTDVDLYVEEPDGNVIYYGHETSLSGGELDRDDTSGFGPENIFWKNAVPDGEYKVRVEYYSGGPQTNYYVTVNAGNIIKSYTGILTRESEQKNVVTVTKRGNSYTFSN